MRFSIVGAAGGAAAAGAGARSVRSAECAASAAYGPECAKTWSVRSTIRRAIGLYTGYVGVRVRMEGRVALHADAIVGAVDARAAGVLGVSVPDFRNADTRGDGGGVDRDAAAEGAVAAAERAAEAGGEQVPAGAAADPDDAALLRSACAHAAAAHAQVRHVPPAAAALLQETSPLPLLGG